MRVIVEQSEIIQLIGQHFGFKPDPNNIKIRTDPLEVEVSGIPMPASDNGPPQTLRSVENLKALSRDVEDTKFNHRAEDPNVMSHSPTEGTDGVDAVETGDMGPAAMIMASRQLEDKLSRESKVTPTRRGGTPNPPTSDGTDER